MTISRRSAIAAIGSSFTFFVPDIPLFGQTLRTRYSVDTPSGQAMLSKYAQAVARMSASTMAQKDPRSWLFQWYIHALPKPKSSELARVYGSGSSTMKTIASEIWQTCQPHFSGSDPNMFLPWHRMYLLTFENIIRSVLSDATFTLPYWDYTRPGYRSIPAMFRKASSSPSGSLYRANRRTGTVNINAGDPMDKGSSGNPYGLDAMNRTVYAGTTGFCTTLDKTLHGNVHTGIGDSTNMGKIPTAANDPIFWLHHCNIDRIWAGWNKLGGVNNYAAKNFTFASPDPKGKRVVMSSTAVGDTVALGYQYDGLPAAPSSTATVSPLARSAGPRPLRSIARSERMTRLNRTETRIPLSIATNGLVSGSIAPSTSTERVYLVLTGLSANVEPGTLYDVFLGLPPSATAQEKKARYLGTFSFFGTSGEHAHGGEAGPSFDVTDRLRQLRARNLLGSDISVTILPVGSSSSEAAPMVGTVELLRQ
ncbi:hypothetical protein C1T17_10260 [Sphingobium sp. SCG-1]|uniref:tyrosinase family protein n=1 Tax=Sphingobium sp. SCG-1 TaxID=2072936 RepID=UPI000CD6A5C6|nr:tyrosinase family protein [Sphingobium sp. SCG-1]AUW58426.1 hypothetical protein C1T17_10260 [Sphingobium sp. SCG-1]